MEEVLINSESTMVECQVLNLLQQQGRSLQQVPID